MRCPYCGGLNREQSTYCVNCGRAIQGTPQPQAPAQAQWPGAQQQATPQNRWPGAQPQAQQPRPGQPPQRPYAPAPNQATRGQQPAPQANARGQQTTAQRPANTPSAGPQQHNKQPAQQHPANVPQPHTQQAQAGRRHAAAPAQAPAQVITAPPAAPEAPAPFPPRTMEQLNTLATGAQPYTVVESSVENGKKKVVRIAYEPCVAWQQTATLLKALQEQQEARYDTVLIQGVFPRQQHTYAFTNGQLQFDRNVRLGSATNNRYMIETNDGFASDAVRFVLNE